MAGGETCLQPMKTQALPPVGLSMDNQCPFTIQSRNACPGSLPDALLPHD